MNMVGSLKLEENDGKATRATASQDPECGDTGYGSGEARGRVVSWISRIRFGGV
jgi:hypothetical protein